MIKINKWLTATTMLASLTFGQIATAGNFDKVKVMSRNLYLGADIFSVTAAAENPDPLAVPLAVAEVFQTMQYTNFPARAQALADEIARYRPHAVGLQEVSTIRQQIPGDFLIGNPAPAEEMVADYLEILMAALVERGLDYQVVAVSSNADVELPMLAGVTPEGAPMFNDVRLTDRDVILVRSDVDTSNSLANHFTYNAATEIGGVSLEFTRGYTAVDMNVKGEDYRFVNTHLEVGGEPGSDFAQLQAAQMYELLTVLSYETKPTLLVGDFNSSPEDALGQPYSQAIGAGYVDLWTQRKRQADGFTCCFNDMVDDAETALYERIDHVFLNPKDKQVVKVKAKVVGDEPVDMTTTEPALWPSDHAGVVVKVKFSKD